MFRFLVFFFLFSFLGARMAYAENRFVFTKLVLPPPVWSCISSVGNDVILNWEQVPDPGGNFIAYEVHSVEDGLLSTISNITTTSFTDVGVSIAKHYFVSVVDNISGATNGTILQNIHLSLTNPANGTALLSWNSSGFSLPGSPSKPIKIFREFPAGIWILRDSVAANTTFYRDTIDLCEEFISYRISHPGNGCDFTSNSLGDDFEDMTTPAMPVVSGVTIDSVSGDVTISWNQNQSEDTYGYVVYLMDLNGFLIEIDTVWGIGNTSLTYSENTSIGPLTYSIAAFDHCFTSSIPPTYQTSAKADEHTSIFLSGKYDACGSIAALNWTPYQGWEVDHYDFFYSDNSSPWIQVANPNSSLQLVVLPTTATYSFVVKATSVDGKIVFSNKINLSATASAAPSINYIMSASVVDQKVNLKHLVDTSGNVSAIAFDWLQKNGSWKEIGRVDAIEPINYFVHENANVEQLNRYRAVVIDSCGNRTITSDTVTTVVLTVQTDSINYFNRLSWTPYIGFDGTVESYAIFRSIDGILEISPITTLASTDFTFEDILGTETVHHNLCYFVVAIEGLNSFGFQESANSNLVCGVYSPRVFIPSAFTPGGVNPVFRPEYSYMKFPDFTMKIIDRWGQEIFETNDPISGWNGTILGGAENAPNDMYRYWIRFYGIDDLQKIYTGHFTLLR